MVQINLTDYLNSSFWEG